MVLGENVKQLKEIHCKNLHCKELICHSDGEFLYVENLEVLPKSGNRESRKYTTIPCPRCRF